MENSNGRKQMEYWVKIVILLCIGWVVIWIDRTTLPPLFAEIQQTVGALTDPQLGGISSCYFFGYAGMQIPAGLLADRFGKKTILIPGFVLFAIGAFTIGSSPTISTIYVGSLISGIGCGFYYGAAYSLSSENIPKAKRGLSTAIINCGSAVGMGVGTITSSNLVKEFGIPWNQMLFVNCALATSMVIACTIIIKGRKHDRAAKVAIASASAGDTNERPKLFSFKMVSASMLYFSTCYGYYMIVTWLPSYLEKERGFVGGAIGFTTALIALASIPGALFFSRMSDKFSHKKVKLIMGLEICTALTLALVVFSSSQQILLVGLALYGLLGKLAVEPILISHIADNAPPKSLGTFLGVFNFFGMSSAVIAPWLTGQISQVTGEKVIGFYVSIVLLFIGTFIFYLGNRKSKATV